jgi:hypothetical protein
MGLIRIQICAKERKKIIDASRITSLISCSAQAQGFHGAGGGMVLAFERAMVQAR